MDCKSKKRCIVLILWAVFGALTVDSATLTENLTPSPAIKGNNRHTIRCDFTLDSGTSDVLQSLKLYLGPVSQGKVVAVVLGSGSPTAGWASSNVPDNLNQRGYVEGSRDAGYLSLVLNDTECDDKDRSYNCYLEFANSATLVNILTKTVQVSVQAAPLAPSDMSIRPNQENVTEFSEMTFQCSGNVGNPAGTFQWFQFIGSASTEVTGQASQGNEVVTGDGCTYTRGSSLTLNVTRTEADQRLVVRCRVNQALVTSDVSACTNPDIDFCRMSPQINVQYPVSVSVPRESESIDEGGGITIECTAQGNPTPYLVEWQKEGENQTVMAGGTLALTGLMLNDTGNYVCTGYNIINSVTRNASATVSVTVEETTTPPPTTTPVPTTPPTTDDPNGNVNRAGSGDDNTTIIIVVVVVVVVVAIIVVVVVVVFLRRRKKGKEVEEPPEKPFNNHSGINTVATRPDVITTGYDNPPPPFKNEDGLAYAELQFDNKPRSRRPLAIDDSHTDYSDVSMPQV